MNNKKQYVTSMFADIMSIIKLIFSISKSFILLVIIRNLLEAVLPFVIIYFSYIILDGIILEVPRNTLYSSVYSMVAVNLSIGLSLALFSRLVNIKTESVSLCLKARIGNKGLTMDYEQLEQEESLDIYTKQKRVVIPMDELMNSVKT